MNEDRLMAQLRARYPGGPRQVLRKLGLDQNLLEDEMAYRERGRGRDQGEHDFDSIFDLIDNLPEEQQEEYHRRHADRYGHREEYGLTDPNEEVEEDRRTGMRAIDKWRKRPAKDSPLTVRGAERPMEQFAGDSAPRRDTFYDRYPGAKNVKSSVWG